MTKVLRNLLCKTMRSRLSRFRASSYETVLAAIYTGQGVIYGIALTLLFVLLRGK